MYFLYFMQLKHSCPDLPPHSLMLDVPSRWNSMLDTFVQFLDWPLPKRKYIVGNLKSLACTLQPIVLLDLRYEFYLK